MPLTLDKAFDPRANSIGFLRWLLAFAVIFAHAGPLAGFYGGHDLGTQISSEQSIGGVAVAGFFFFSGYLITQSRRGKSTIFRFFWRRALRIFPAFWLALLTTAFILAPIAWHQETGSMAGFWDADTESPFTYFLNNMWLELGQRNIAGMGSSLPFASIGGFDWNGSAWTLFYEFRAYILVGILGLFGVFSNRIVGAIIAFGIIGVNFLTWSGWVEMTSLSPLLTNPFYPMFFAPFAFGMLFALFGDKIPIDDRLAVLALGVAGFAYAFGGWNMWGQYGLMYFLMWFAIRTPRLNRWEKHGDLSYGIYIFAWPLMQFGAYFGLQNAGWFVYHLVIAVAAHICAYASWHLIESPAMSLKNWTPKWLAWLLARGAPYVDAVKGRIVNPAYSSSNFATRIRDGHVEARR
ncbi:acyltransferase [Pseudoclavibacter sp. RFBG4]|uniref:acyltransferase family protein n=1 Tax=Pseudoclavibacter sp. RFBG4 TaxID=2080575 RepID=UPI000CE845CF|nr:acyltransferase [Pseudoclavibacter sp. RFBG4]PPG35398.1 acyltransferase [Pseudoclavibacter sp. RFBG4]